MKRPIRWCFLLLLCLSALSACMTSDVTPLLASDDCGPKPQNYHEIAAAWFNAHYRFTPPNPIKPEELSISEPTRVATADWMLGRTVGWQVILGPENKVVTNFTDMAYTRLIINRGRIVSITSSDQSFIKH
jgi:hypothetical protein